MIPARWGVIPTRAGPRASSGPAPASVRASGDPVPTGVRAFGGPAPTNSRASGGGTTPSPPGSAPACAPPPAPPVALALLVALDRLSGRRLPACRRTYEDAGLRQRGRRTRRRPSAPPFRCTLRSPARTSRSRNGSRPMRPVSMRKAYERRAERGGTAARRRPRAVLVRGPQRQQPEAADDLAADARRAARRVSPLRAERPRPAQHGRGGPAPARRGHGHRRDDRRWRAR